MILSRISGGGKKIKDATALPQNVENGKVFYNNGGRQVGNAEVKKYFTSAIPVAESTSLYTIECKGAIITEFGTLYGPPYIDNIRYTKTSYNQMYRTFSDVVSGDIVKIKNVTFTHMLGHGFASGGAEIYDSLDIDLTIHNESYASYNEINFASSRDDIFRLIIKGGKVYCYYNYTKDYSGAVHYLKELRITGYYI